LVLLYRESCDGKRMLECSDGKWMMAKCGAKTDF